jgi:hypothetical protein
LLSSPFSSSYYNKIKQKEGLSSPSAFQKKPEGDSNCRPLLFVFVLLHQEEEEGNDNFVAVTFFSGFFLEGKRGWQLLSPSFLCFVARRRRKKKR